MTGRYSINNVPMNTKSNPRRDFTQVAFGVVQQATGGVAPEPELTGKKADSSKGGKKGACRSTHGGTTGRDCEERSSGTLEGKVIFTFREEGVF